VLEQNGRQAEERKRSPGKDEKLTGKEPPSTRGKGLEGSVKGHEKKRHPADRKSREKEEGKEKKNSKKALGPSAAISEKTGLGKEGGEPPHGTRQNNP